MSRSVRIQLMGNLLITIDGKRVEDPVSRSRKGAALMAFLILRREQKTSNQVLIRALWPGGTSVSPSTALKTLISRMRAILNEMVEGMGNCIVSDRGAYHWENLPGMSIDVWEIMDIFDRLAWEHDVATIREYYRRLSLQYRGDLFQTGCLDEESVYAEQLHSQYLNAMYSYIDLLRQGEEYNEISEVCRRGLEVDNFDDRLHLEMMRAMVNLNRTRDAISQYRAADSASRYLDVEPSEEMKSFYNQIPRRSKLLKFNLDVFRNALSEGDAELGAFVCDLEIFRAIYNLYMRKLARAGITTMYLAAFRVGDETLPSDRARHARVAAALMEIMRKHLRRGDIISQFSPTIILLLLPFPDLETGNMVMERLHQLYLHENVEGNVPIEHRLGRLGKSEEEDQTELW